MLLFARVDPLGVAWLRIASAGVIFAAWRRPWRALRACGADARRLVVSFGVVLAVMNTCFYVAIDRLPLGTVAAIEFLPVIVLAALGARSAPNLVALGLAVAGVYALVDVRLEGEPVGVAFAFANAVLFAAYIVLAHRLARAAALSRIDGLAAAMLVAVVVVTPIGGWSAARALLDPVALAAGYRRRRRLVGRALRLRPAGDGAAEPCGLLADGRTAARHGDGDRRHRPGAGADARRGPRRRPRRRRRRAPPRAGRDALRVRRMEQVRLGTTGLHVSRVCLGMMSYYAGAASRPWMLDEAAAEPIVRRAVEGGITFFDTADMYSDGGSEVVTGRLLPKLLSRDELVVATKVYFPMTPGPNGRGLSRKHILAAIDASLTRLGLDYVDLYQIHRWDRHTPIEETMEALHDVVRAGKARYLGASSMYAWQFAKAQRVADRHGWTPFVSMQNHYNLVYREEEREMIPQCIDQGVGVLPWSPLARGFLRARERERASA